MFKVVILDNTLNNKDLYYDVFENDGEIRLIDIVDKMEDLKKVLSVNDVDLLAVNSSLMHSKSMGNIKEISKEFSLNLMILNNRVTFNEEKKAEEQLDKIKRYFCQECLIVNNNNIVTIASSTGGPKAIQSIIPKLPSNLNGIIIIVQHMPASFTSGFALRLDSISAISVKEAKNGERLENGVVYIAPGDFHMYIEEIKGELIVKLTKEEKFKGVRPAADLLMKSVAKINNYNKIGIVLTGMGTDGSDGIKYLKEAGSYNIVQNEETSTIFGMPKAAIETGYIDEVTPLESIWESIILKVGCKKWI